MDPSYCGECYGAPAPPSATKAGCCNTCTEVRDAYASVSWSFGRGENVEQCEREHYSEHLDAQRKEGCRIDGSIRVNKVVGNFHFAPGKSFSNGQMHVHDLENYFRSEEAHTFTHTIHSLRFGPPMSAAAQKRFADASKQGQTWATGYTQTNPLDGLILETNERPYNYMYFVKVVSTAYLPLGWESKGKKDGSGGLWSSSDGNKPAELIALGEYGTGPAGSIETHQYSVTRHERNLEGGTDAAEGHKERLHARGGIPGVFFVSGSSRCFQTYRANLTTVLRHLTHESYQQREADKDIFRVPSGRLRSCWRYLDSRSGDRQGLVRGLTKDEEAA